MQHLLLETYIEEQRILDELVWSKKIAVVPEGHMMNSGLELQSYAETKYPQTITIYLVFFPYNRLLGYISNPTVHFLTNDRGDFGNDFGNCMHAKLMIFLA
ncbi:hypothetical protein RF11_14623 [Thelohanellus kitauei]|uniref:Uncharacterized protein n=1 Tax=Thelohanellus kitauei TaxID=669202 RepID=A0A0C2MBF8_THEKT|nr:hypothetical protein RF11_14623 [Thelohanellus kitauei]